MSQQVLKAVTVKWLCNKPGAAKFPGLVQFCEKTVEGVARTLDKDEAIIRKEPHTTTRVDGKLVKNYPNHITADFTDSSTGEGLAAHVYVDDQNTKMLEPSTGKPNPKTWPLPATKE